MPTIWIGLAGTIAVFLELVYRTRGWTWLAAPPALLLTFAICQALQLDSASYLTVMATFNLATLLVRGGISVFALNEPLVNGNAAALVLMLAASILGRFWR